MSKVGEYQRELEERGLIDNGPQHPSEMKARPIKNLLKHCQRTDKKLFKEFGNRDEWIRNKGWIQAIEYVINNYNCTPK